MLDPQVRFDEVIAALKARDFRLTPQRVELVRMIASSEEHPSAGQLYARIRRKFPTMSQATVYKTLALLKDIGQVLEIDLRDDSHYDGHRPRPHPHLICIECNEILDGEVAPDPSAIRKIEKTSGYKILRSQVSFYGLCPRCRAKSVRPRSPIRGS
jgi:Fur family peroxide stress response transcriptional regulator